MLEVNKKPPEQSQLRRSSVFIVNFEYSRSGVFIVNFEHISLRFLMFLLLTLNK